MKESEDGEGEGGAGDKPSDAPPEESQQGASGEQGEETDGESKPSDGDPNNDAGGKWRPNDMIINGEISYRDVLNEYKDHAEELLEDPDSGLTDEEREILKKYLGIV